MDRGDFRPPKGALDEFVKTNLAEVVAQRYIEAFQAREEREESISHLVSLIMAEMGATRMRAERGKPMPAVGPLTVSASSEAGNKSLESR